ncbi:hypothetical protein ANCDUO_09932 [Ancylostoma duodenale]|uniref:Retrotransposon gag domain-containing protein n=1 Tax=Ancylostoma duodenale TaxID=51022 RepID=A0A0C2GLK6_9BILA|nr:hypothetical protein ANCDUO_09932 [Ancylostoma duodenale]
MEELVECATIVSAIEEATSWSQETIVEHCTDLSNVVAQKEAEFSQLQAKLVEQQREIERLKRTGNAEGREMKLDIPGKAMKQQKWARQAAASEQLDGSRVEELLAEDTQSARSVLSSESDSPSLEESSSSEGESSRSRVRGAPGRHDHMNAYLKYIALPEVPCFSGRDRDNSWESFLEAFSMKYPRQSWSGRVLKALLKAKLMDKAKAQYEALPKEVRHGSFEGLVEALSAAHRADRQTRRVVALGKLRQLRKAETQTVAEFCVELERLSAKAYPEMDEVALATIRAQQLYGQLVPLKECGGGEANVRMHVCKRKGNTLILGTNALPALSYKLVCEDKPGVGETVKESTETGRDIWFGTIPISQTPNAVKVEAPVVENKTVLVHSKRKRGRRKRMSVLHSRTITLDNDAAFRNEDDYDVVDPMHFLHVKFACDGQPFPSVSGRPGFPLTQCRCSQNIVVGDLLPMVPQPAYDERVECVLDAVGCTRV